MIGYFLKMLFFLALAVWLGGLFWYLDKIPSQPSSYRQPTDAIIVLTGGGRRLAKGFVLLKENMGKEMLITGVGEGVRLEELLAQQNVDALAEAIRARAISLDHDAISTTTNAQEAAKWMEKKHFTTARLVTANYHMPRALLEFGVAMPDITFRPEPVFPKKEFQREEWYLYTGSIKLLVTEYMKYVVTAVKYFQSGQLKKLPL